MLLALSFALAVQESATVTGVVYDSLARVPLAGAEVQFTALADSTGHTVFRARSDSLGQYQLAGLPAGRYVAVFAHTAVDTMGLERPPLAVALGTGTRVVNLGGPSEATIMRAACPGGRSGAGSVLLGQVTGARTGLPLLGAQVLVTRTEVTIVGRSPIRRPVTDVAEVGDDGAFAICGVPNNTPLQVRAATGDDTTGVISLRLATRTVRHLTLTLGSARREVVRRTGAGLGVPGSSVMAWRGPARLAGRVVNPLGAPMAGARVQVLGAEREATTGENGAWSLDSLPEGTQVLEVRAIGYEPMRPIVQVGANAAPIEVRLMYRTVTLDEVLVRGSYERNMEAFEQRRRTSASGHFLGPEDILKRPPDQVLGRLISDVPQMIVDCKILCEYVMMFSGRVRPATDALANSRANATREICAPTLYIDGVLQRMPDYNFLSATQIAGVEVYTRMFVPAQFMDMYNECGAIVVWTKLRAPRK